MAKKITSFQLEESTLELLKKLVVFHNRSSQTNMLDELIKQAAKKAGIK